MCLADGDGLVEFRDRKLQDGGEMDTPVRSRDPPTGFPSGHHAPVRNAVAATAGFPQRLGQGVLGLAQPFAGSRD
jgi:hypothetical protein